MEKYLLILSGGKGCRLWPISTEKSPKQFLNLYSDEIMVNETIRRVEKIYKTENIFIIINNEQKELGYRYIDARIPRSNIIVEPIMKNTAMCIFYGVMTIKRKREIGTVTILPSDHYIYEEDKLIDNICSAIKTAEKDENLVTIGVKATYPETRFGYIKYSKNSDNENYYNVIDFKEKPSSEKASEYFESNEYIWNSGMLFGKMDSILNSFRKYLPNIYKYRKRIAECIGTQLETKNIKEIYEEVDAISIDKGILEKSDSIKMIKADFEWSDIGSLDALFEARETDENNNTTWGKYILKNTRNSNIYNGEDGLLITIGLSNVSIVKNNNLCLICSNDKIGEITKIYEFIKHNEEYKRFL